METVFLAQNLAKTATITADSTESGLSLASLVDDRLLTKWRPTGSGSQSLYLDFGTAQSFTGLALLGTNLQTRAALTISGSANGSTWTTLTPETLVLLADSFALFSSAQIYRYLRIQIPSGSAVAEITTLIVGTALALPRPLRPAQREIEIKQAVGMDSSGEAYTYNRQPFDGISHPLTFRRLTQAQRDALETLYRRDSVGSRSFFGWIDHLGVVHAVRFVDSRIKFFEDGLDRYRVDLILTEASAAL